MTRVPSLLFALALALAAACGSDDPSGPPAERPSFLVASSVYSDQSAATYLNYEASLEVDELDRSRAIELAGGATIAGFGGAIFVGDGEAPTVTRYELDGDGAPVETGKVSFANAGAASTLFTNWFAGPARAYVDISGDQRLIWDPGSMTTVGKLAISNLARKQGNNELWASYDRGVAVRDGKAFQPFYWANFDFYTFHPSSQIAVIDTARDAVASMIDAPCPGLDVATRDDQGNIYIGPWTFSQLLRLSDPAQPENCVIKIPAGGETFDPTWTRSFSSLTGGREAGALRNIGNGVALLSVLDPALVPPSTPARQLAGLSIWRLWRVDLASWTGAPIDGLEPFDGGYYAFLVDGKAVVLLPYEDYSKTQAFEIPPAGAAIPRFKTLGWAYQLVDL
jgi:hypothetical protein